MRKPVLCVLSEIPGLASITRERCGAILSKVHDIDPTCAKADDPKIQEAEIIISEPHHANLWLYGLPNLKFVQGTWAGINSMMCFVDAKKTPEFSYSRFAGRFGQAMSEYVIGHIIAHERSLRMVYEAQAQSSWSGDRNKDVWLSSRALNEMSIGILGLGDIGRKVALHCKTFGMKVWGLVNTIPTGEGRCSYVDEFRRSSDLDEVLSNCDYICSLLPSTPQTRGLLDNNRFKACGSKRAVFVNVGRGDICSEESILHALNEGWLRAAILDVFPSEPLSSESALWKHPNVTITPHVAALSKTKEVGELLVENVENYVHERPLKYIIDWNKGY